MTDRQTDGRTVRRTDDQGKNNMSPNPTGGDIIIKLKKRALNIILGDENIDFETAKSSIHILSFE